MKGIVIGAMLLLSFSVFAEGLKFYSFGEFAYYPMKSEKYIPDDEILFSTNLGAGISYKWLFVEANQFVDITKANKWYFSPYREKYYVTAGIQVWAFQIGYQHLCTHTIDYYPLYKDNYDKVFINFDTRRIRVKD